MNPENNSPKPDGGQVAVQYINDQLEKTRASLQRTRMIGLLLVIVVLAYMSYVTMGIRAQLEPVSAAKIANGIILEQVDSQAQAFANRLKQGIPEFLGMLPDYALREMPAMRAEIENRVEADFASYSKLTSQQAGKHLDAFLNDHKDKIKEMLASGQDIAAVRQLGPELEAEILAYFKTQFSETDKETIVDKFNSALGALDQVSETLKRLAHNPNPTPQELKTRRAIAVLLKKADWKTAVQESQ